MNNISSNRIFLVGLMGCGKTHWAERIARQLNSEFIDLDRFIEQGEKLSIPEIFGKYGEQHFRQLETKYLNQLSEKENVVVAAGGGTPCFNNNMELMNSLGETYYLQTEVETLVKRVRNQTKERPLIKDLGEQELIHFFTKNLKERERFYKIAKHVVEEEKLNDEDLREIFAAAGVQER